MIETYGLTHLSLDVRDVDVSLRFYQAMFGVKEYFRDNRSVQVLGPGKHDVIAFVKSARAGKVGGISHFGFRLKNAADMEHAVATAISLGAVVKSRGEFAPGYPYLHVLDPDGYEIEIWYE